MRISIACWDSRGGELQRLHVIDISRRHGVLLTDRDHNDDYVWSLERLCAENRRMLGVETHGAPWLKENDVKVLKRAARLFGAACICDSLHGRLSEALLDVIAATSWLSCQWFAWRCEFLASRNTALGGTCHWFSKLLVAYQEQDKERGGDDAILEQCFADFLFGIIASVETWLRVALVQE